MPSPVFLSAEWRRLIMANYTVDPSVLAPYVPYGTELDTWQGRHYISLVGFMFLNTRLKGIPIPFHRNFEEINLRFYVRQHDPELGWKRGTVFIKEIVPRAAITWVANTFYGEHYVTLPTRHQWHDSPDRLQVAYEWKFGGRWQRLAVEAATRSEAPTSDSEATFITEHYWGYVQRSPKRTTTYQVEHPPWDIHEVNDFEVDCDGAKLYGAAFGEALNASPKSVFMAAGSPVLVRQGNPLQLTEK